MMAHSIDIDDDDLVLRMEALIIRVHAEPVGDTADWLAAQNELQVLRMAHPGVFARLWRSLTSRGAIRSKKRQYVAWRKPH